MNIKKTAIIDIVRWQANGAIYWRKQYERYKRNPAHNDMAHWVYGRYEQAITDAKKTATLLKEGK